MKISKAQIAHLIAAPIVVGVTWVSVVAAKHLPWLPQFSNEQIGVFAVGVGVVASTAVIHYLKGLREWQRLEAEGIISIDEGGEGTGATLDPRFHEVPVKTTPEKIEGDAGKLGAVEGS